jgi:protein SCO1/2
MKRRRQFVGWVVVALIAGGLGACQPSEKHYQLRGRVLAKNGSELTVNHEEIPGLMPAMAMPYQVPDRVSLNKVQTGDWIKGELVGRNNEYRLEHIIVTSSGGADPVEATTAQELQPGDRVPDLPMINQDGKTVHLRDFKGKSVLVTFIYTRCPFPTFCPLLSNELASVNRELKKDSEVFSKTHLMSVSLEPSYDTPPVMRTYGLGYINHDPAGFAHWDFVATTPDDLKKLAGAFGLTYFVQDNQITHSMLTVLIGPDGAVSNVWPGNKWRKAEIVQAMQQSVSNK